MKAIEMETVISPDGKLPPFFCEAFGQKAHVIVLLHEKDQANGQTNEQRICLSVRTLWEDQRVPSIEDPVAFQRALRDEWTREWDE